MPMQFPLRQRLPNLSFGPLTMPPPGPYRPPVPAGSGLYPLQLPPNVLEEVGNAYSDIGRRAAGFAGQLGNAWMGPHDTVGQLFLDRMYGAAPDFQGRDAGQTQAIHQQNMEQSIRDALEARRQQGIDSGQIQPGANYLPPSNVAGYGLFGGALNHVDPGSLNQVMPSTSMDMNRNDRLLSRVPVSTNDVNSRLNGWGMAPVSPSELQRNMADEEHRAARIKQAQEQETFKQRGAAQTYKEARLQSAISGQPMPVLQMPGREEPEMVHIDHTAMATQLERLAALRRMGPTEMEDSGVSAPGAGISGMDKYNRMTGNRLYGESDADAVARQQVNRQAANIRARMIGGTIGSQEQLNEALRATGNPEGVGLAVGKLTNHMGGVSGFTPEGDMMVHPGYQQRKFDKLLEARGKIRDRKMGFGHALEFVDRLQEQMGEEGGPGAGMGANPAMWMLNPEAAAAMAEQEQARAALAAEQAHNAGLLDVEREKTAAGERIAGMDLKGKEALAAQAREDRLADREKELQDRADARAAAAADREADSKTRITIAGMEKEAADAESETVRMEKEALLEQELEAAAERHAQAVIGVSEQNFQLPVEEDVTGFQHNWPVVTSPNIEKVFSGVERAYRISPKLGKRLADRYGLTPDVVQEYLDQPDIFRWGRGVVTGAIGRAGGWKKQADKNRASARRLMPYLIN